MFIFPFFPAFRGTVAQVEHGLYAAQERYFFSFFFKVFGIIPFPGAQLILWVLFFNLIASAITHFSKTRGWGSVGLKISHCGVLIYFISAFVTFHGSQESYVHLLEKEGTNVSSSYQDWELAYWKDNAKSKQRQVSAVDVTKLKSGVALPFKDVPWVVTLQQFYPNAGAYTKGPHSIEGKILNASGIVLLEPKEVLKEREKNIAGAIFHLKVKDQSYALLLYGAESKPTPLNVQGQTYYFNLRHKRYTLPFLIKLKDFKVEFHPGTQIAKSYESIVEVIKGNAKRDVRIYMNNPLRDKSYTFYQASYDIDASGREYSTLAVVKNEGQLLPYIACFVVFFGLAFHFIMAAFRRKRS